jgi:hypothetical protein
LGQPDPSRAKSSGHTDRRRDRNYGQTDRADKALVADFINKALITFEESVHRLYQPASYTFNPMVAERWIFQSFMGEMAAKGITATYIEVHKVIRRRQLCADRTST